jgi:predicted metal-dependent peptidase
LFDEMEKDGRIKQLDTFDVHLDREEGDDAGAEQSNEDGENGPVKYTQEEKDKIKQEFQNAVMQSAKASGAGNLPGGIKRMLSDLLNPQLDWRELLAMQIKSVIKNDYTMMRPSRKGLDAGFYWHGLR